MLSNSQQPTIEQKEEEEEELEAVRLEDMKEDENEDYENFDGHNNDNDNNHNNLMISENDENYGTVSIKNSLVNDVVINKNLNSNRSNKNNSQN